MELLRNPGLSKALQVAQPAGQAQKFSPNKPARKNQFVEPIQQIYPTGKSPESPSSPFGKNILIFRNRKSVYIPPVSPDERGGSRSSRTRGGMRWTRELRLTSATRADGEVVWFLTPQGWRQVRGKQNFSRATVTSKSGSPRRARISLKPLRRESRIASAEPVCSCAFLLVHFAHETAGAARIRLSLRPLLSEGGNRRKARAHRAARMRTHIYCLKIESELSQRHCEERLRRSNPAFFCAVSRKLDCFASLAMTLIDWCVRQKP